MKVPYIIFPALCDPEMCRSIIEHGQMEEVLDGTVHHAEVNREQRRSKIAWLHTWKAEYRDLTELLTHHMHQANMTFGFDVTWLQSFQFTEYDAAYRGFYGEHVDAFFDERSLYQRKISMSLQLSDPADYDGGDLLMKPVWGQPPEPAILRQQGTVIFFPAFTPHQVTPISRGTRRSLVAWWVGPSWR